MSQQKAQPVALLLVGIGGVGKSTIAPHLTELLREQGRDVLHIRFDEMRKRLVPAGMDPFSKDVRVKSIIYEAACREFVYHLERGRSLVIDSGLSNESIRKKLKSTIPQLRICHVFCPLLVAIFRDSRRSLLNSYHERGRWLHLRALIDLVNPFKCEKFSQPGITCLFDFPASADLHVCSFPRGPRRCAIEIIEKLRLAAVGLDS